MLSYNYKNLIKIFYATNKHRHNFEKRKLNITENGVALDGVSIVGNIELF